MDKPPATRIFNCSRLRLVPARALGLWRRRRELGRWLAIGAPAAGRLGVAALFMGNPRFREPYDLFILMGAAIGLVALWDRFVPSKMSAP